jgi:hypothetical protein
LKIRDPSLDAVTVTQVSGTFPVPAGIVSPSLNPLAACLSQSFEASPVLIVPKTQGDFLLILPIVKSMNVRKVAAVMIHVPDWKEDQ